MKSYFSQKKKKLEKSKFKFFAYFKNKYQLQINTIHFFFQEFSMGIDPPTITQLTNPSYEFIEHLYINY